MREVKFRAWDKSNGITNCFCIHSSGKVAYTNNEWLDDKDKPVIMQYTGLQDENDKEIYEGDIVEHRGVGYTVVWNDGASNIGEHNDKWGDQLGWYLNRETNVEGCYDEWLDMSSDMIYEVIGNIYENSEITTGLDK